MHGAGASIAVGCCLLLLANRSMAQELPGSPEWLVDLPNALHEAGVDVSLATTLESTAAVSGHDRDRASSAHAQVLDLGIEFDLERARLLPATTLRFAFSQRAGDPESIGADAIQGSSGLDARNGDQLYALNLTYAPDEHCRYVGGLIDSNDTFAALASTGDFIHASAGTSPTIVGMPTWPDTALGAQFHLSWSSGWELNVGAFRAIPKTAQLQPLGAAVLELPRRELDQGIFSVAEVGWRSQRGSNRFGVGTWYDASQTEQLDQTVSRGSNGAYALWEHTLFDRRSFGADAFAVLGWTEPELTDAATHAMVGLRLRGPLQTRPHDSFGLLVSLAGPNLLAEGRNEMVTEAYYRAALTELLHLQLGAIHTQARSDSRDSLVFGFRFSHSF